MSYASLGVHHGSVATFPANRVLARNPVAPPPSAPLRRQGVAGGSVRVQRLGRSDGVAV